MAGLSRPARSAGAPNAAWAALALLLCGACAGTSVGPPINGDLGVAIRGRVVDFETCLSSAGCTGVAALRVSVLSDSALVSAPTGPDGAFTLDGVPTGSRVHLIVSDAGGTGRFLPTLQAGVVALGSEDVFGIECYALQARGGLYEALQAEAQLEIAAQGLYLGQVVQITEGKMKALDAVTPTLSPPATLRFVRDNPRFSPGQQALFPADRTFTGIFGQFVAITPTAQQLYRVDLAATDLTFEPSEALIGAGYLSIAMHRAIGQR